MKISISKEELSKFAPYVDEAIENKQELALLKLAISLFPKGNDYYNVVDYTLDSYNNLTKCMRKWEAKENSLYNGLEYLLVKHYTVEENENGKDNS